MWNCLFFISLACQHVLVTRTHMYMYILHGSPLGGMWAMECRVAVLIGEEKNKKKESEQHACICGFFASLLSTFLPCLRLASSVLLSLSLLFYHYSLLSMLLWNIHTYSLDLIHIGISFIVLGVHLADSSSCGISHKCSSRSHLTIGQTSFRAVIVVVVVVVLALYDAFTWSSTTTKSQCAWLTKKKNVKDKHCLFYLRSS